MAWIQFFLIHGRDGQSGLGRIAFLAYARNVLRTGASQPRRVGFGERGGNCSAEPHKSKRDWLNAPQRRRRASSEQRSLLEKCSGERGAESWWRGTWAKPVGRAIRTGESRKGEKSRKAVRTGFEGSNGGERQCGESAQHNHTLLGVLLSGGMSLNRITQANDKSVG